MDPEVMTVVHRRLGVACASDPLISNTSLSALICFHFPRQSIRGLYSR